MNILNLLLLSVIIKQSMSQRFEQFQSGIISISPQSYFQNQGYRDFTIQPSSLMVKNNDLVFSYLSISYFDREAYCQQKERNQSSIIVSCSGNIYRLSYLMIEKGPNIFVVYNERIYKNRSSAFDTIDISRWVQGLKFPLEQLIRKDRFSQYQIGVDNFICGISTASGDNIRETQNIVTIKPKVINRNITFDDNSKLLIPTGVNVTLSLNIEKVALFSIIYIKQMISLNMQFQTFLLYQQIGLCNMDYFAGISQFSFYISNNTIEAFKSIWLNTSYNISQSNVLIKDSQNRQRFNRGKLTRYEKSKYLDIKLTKLSQFYYKRCQNQQLTIYKQSMYLSQGRQYRLIPLRNDSLTVDIEWDGSLVLSLWDNSQSQKFYIYDLGQGRYKLLNKLNRNPVMTNRSQKLGYVKYGQSKDQNQYIWSIYYSVQNEIDYSVQNESNFRREKSSQVLIEWNNSTMYMGVQNTTIEGARMILKNYTGNKSQDIKWVFIQVNREEQTLYSSIKESQSVPTTTNSNQTVNENINQTIHTQFYFTTLQSFTSNNLAQLPPQGYYNIQEGNCYSQQQTHLIHLDTNTTLMPYFLNPYMSLSQLIQLNRNISSLNISSLYLSQNSLYPLLMNKNTLNKFFSYITQGLVLFTLQDNSFILIFFNHTSSSTNNTTTKVNTLPFGCQSVIFDLNGSLQCQTCKQNYILYQQYSQHQSLLYQNQSTQPIHQSPNLTQPISKCYCPISKFMTQKGQCLQCSLHQSNCQPPINIQVQILKQQSQSNSFLIQDNQIKQLQIKLYILKTPSTSFQFLSSIEELINYLTVFVNQHQYPLPSNTLINCIDPSTLLCIKFTIPNVNQSPFYKVKVAIKDQNDNSNTQSNKYLLVKETPSSPTLISSSSYDFISLIHSLNPLRLLFPTQYIKSQSIQTSSGSSFYFIKFQTYETVVKQPITVQTVIQNIQPVISNFNDTSSVILMAAPFLLQKFNLFSILQTNSILYMISFMKFKNNKNNKANTVQSITQKMFIFRQDPPFKLFSIQNQLNYDQSTKGYIQLPKYVSKFQQSFLYNSTLYDSLSYPKTLHSSAIPSLSFNFQSQNYLTMTLNSFLYILIQIILMQLFIKLAKLLCSQIKSTKKNQKGQQITTVKLIQFDLKRHSFISGLDSSYIQQTQQKQTLNKTQHELLLTQKRLQWIPMPEIKQCQISKSTQPQQLSSNQLQEEIQSFQLWEQQNKQDEQVTIKEKVLFFAYELQQKKLIFYTSFIIIQLISQSYLLYFQLIKPFTPSHQDIGLTLLAYLDIGVSTIMMFLIIIFPVFLINYYPLHLLKIVQVINKFGAYKLRDSKQNEQSQYEGKNENINTKFMEHSYTYGEIFFNFSIVYYEIILIPLSVGFGTNLFYQALPIFLYKLFKLIWLFKKLKVLDKLKLIAMSSIFFLIAVLHFIQSQSTIYLLQDFIILGMYLVLFIQLGKLVKFVLVSIVNLLKTKRKDQFNHKQLSTKTQMIKSQAKFPKQISIKGLQYEQSLHVQQQSDTNKVILDSKKGRTKTIKFRQIQPEQTIKIIHQTQKAIQNTKLKRRNRHYKTNITKKHLQIDHQKPNQQDEIQIFTPSLNFVRKRQKTVN